MTNAKRKQKSESTTKAKTSEKVHLAPVPAAEPVVSAETEAPAAKDEASSPLGNAPLYKERLGRVHLAIWAQEDKNGTVRYSVKLTRSYKTAAGFRDTSSLSQSDLADAIALLTQAQEMLPPLAVSVPQAEA